VDATIAPSVGFMEKNICRWVNFRYSVVSKDWRLGKGLPEMSASVGWKVNKPFRLRD
jgi:hypothetical protein